jgi:hypothetical protein
VASNKETKPETKDKPNPFEQRPKTVNPETARKLGETAIKGASKDKSKK